jgi:hypothetical protein
MGSVIPIFCQRLICVSAVSMTHSPISRLMAWSSIMGKNCRGELTLLLGVASVMGAVYFVKLALLGFNKTREVSGELLSC